MIYCACKTLIGTTKGAFSQNERMRRFLWSEQMTEPTRPNAGWQSENIVYGNIITGETIVGTTSAILGTAQASLVMLKAAAGNAGTVYIGATGVTTVGTVNNLTAGWQLTAGESTAWLPISNVSNLWGIASAASQVVFFVALS